MRRRTTVLSVSTLVALLVTAGVVVFSLWPNGSAADDKARKFCWKVSARISSGGEEGSASACAASLEKAAKTDRSALRTEVRLYGRHLAKDPEGMPVPVRRAMARALAERPGIVHEGLAGGGARESEATRPYLSRTALLSTVLAVARDGVALRVLRASQESYVLSRIATLTRADFEQGEDSERMVTVVEPAGRATATLTSLTQHVRQDVPRGKRADYYSRHGYPRVRDQIVHRARAVGVPRSDILNSGSSTGDIRFAAERAYTDAANEAEAAAHRADPS